MDQVLLTADRTNIEEAIDLAVECDLGVEIMNFAYPDVLDGNWEHEVATYRTILRRVPGPITLHGPFMDMVSGSPDNRINELCSERYQHAIHIAYELDIKLVVLHANFIGSLHNTFYREGWHERNVPFWAAMAEFAGKRGVTIAMENMWEFEPGIIGDLLKAVDHPYLRACLDVGHAHLFSDAAWNLDDWIDALAPWLAHTHMNNNNGIIDEHYGFDWENGVLDYRGILPRLRELPTAPTMVLEMYHVADMRDSLHYFELNEDAITTQTVRSINAHDTLSDGTAETPAEEKIIND
jgi:sugar phosphate isomerase/epimerase